MAMRFNRYKDVDGGRLEIRGQDVTGFLIIAGRKYKVHWIGAPDLGKAHAVYEFGTYDPNTPDAVVGDYRTLDPNQTGWCGEIAQDGSYIEWYSETNGRCVIEGFTFREVS